MRPGETHLEIGDPITTDLNENRFARAGLKHRQVGHIIIVTSQEIIDELENKRSAGSQ